jgi:hypothetical protein
MRGSCRDIRERFHAMPHGNPHNQASGNAHSDVDFCHRESNFPQVWELEYPHPVSCFCHFGATVSFWPIAVTRPLTVDKSQNCVSQRAHQQ